MRPRDLSALDFPRVTARVADFAASAAGQERCRGLTPTADRQVADAALERAWQLHRLLEQHGDPPLPGFADVRPFLRSAAHQGFVLDGKTLVQVRDTLAAIRSVGAFFRRHAEAAPALAGLPERLVAFPALEAELGRALDDDGNVLDAASPALARVRASIRRLRDGLQRKLEELLARRGLADVIADDYVTLRNNRFVVPVRAGAIGSLPGVVQDRSVSGETLFVEPLFAVEMNNELLLAVREEELIVQRILTDLTGLAGAAHAAITASIDALVEVDCLVAAARFARAYRGTRPRFSDFAVELRHARHPGLLFTGRPVTPIDLLLPADRRVLVVTGPNTGGKTVALKTLGLCALMAQSGLLIPADEGARLPCFRAVYADVGDEQNIERNLSTFSAHVANLCEIAAAGPRGALVLLDEPGVGTDPEEGAALAIGLLRWFDAEGAHLALTTHYTPLKLLALDDPRCAVAAVDVDVDALTPRYRLVYDSIGRSLAIPIARRLGLPEAILATAAGVQPEHARRLNAALERLERTRAQLEARLAAAADQTRTLTANAAESTRLLGELRDRRRSAWQEEVREARDFLRQLKAEGRAQLEGLRGVAEARAALDRFTREQEAAIAAREHAEALGPPPAPAATPAAAEEPRRGRRHRRRRRPRHRGRAARRRGRPRLDPARDDALRGAGRATAQGRRRRAGAAAGQHRRPPAPPTRPASPSSTSSACGRARRSTVSSRSSTAPRAPASSRCASSTASAAAPCRRAIQSTWRPRPTAAAFAPANQRGGAGATIATLR
ncbi:MAG: endonuclease MutS2 [Candidatus Binatia bacterium]